MSHKSSVPLNWRLFKKRYCFLGTCCEKCDENHFPPLKLCKKCGKKTADLKFSGLGTIVSFTTIHTAPDGFDIYVPYNVVLVKLDEGPIISAQFKGKIDDSCIGKKVRSVFRKMYTDGNSGINQYNFKFELL